MASEVSPAIASIVETWAKGIAGAPRQFGKLVEVTRAEERVVVRITSEIARRDIVEAKVAAPVGFVALGEKLDKRTIDPWSLTPELLRAKTETLVRCTTCNGARGGACVTCNGSTRIGCTSCGGRGTVAGARCALCNGAGMIVCTSCEGRGVSACAGCNGSGAQILFLKLEETTRVELFLTPDPQAIRAYPKVSEKRAFEAEDFAAFRVHVSVTHAGAIPTTDLEPDDYNALDQHRPILEKHAERIVRQQFARLAIVRRELSYEMCGMHGTLVFSGSEFVGNVEEAVTPIAWRLRVWGIASAVLLVLFTVNWLYLYVPGAYFRAANVTLGMLTLLAAGCSVVVAGGLLRAWKPRGFGTLRLYEKILGGTLVIALIVIAIVQIATRPTYAEAKEALAAGNITKATALVQALAAIHADSEQIESLKEDVEIALADKLPNAERIKALDAIVAREGPRMLEARRDARGVRFADVRARIEAHKLTDALSALVSYFPDRTKPDVEVDELRASIYDAQIGECNDDPCRFAAALRAQNAAKTPARSTRLSGLRATLVAMLASKPGYEESPLQRLQRLHDLEVAARAVAAAAEGEGELVEKANGTIKWIASERDRTPLIGADQPTLEALLGKLDDGASDHPRVDIEGASVFLAMDKTRRCVGVYVVGATRDVRKQGMRSEYLPGLLLSRALGRPTPLKAPLSVGPSSLEITQDGIAIAARWRDGALAELRVGDAAPSGKPKVKTLPRTSKPATASFVAYPGGEIVVDGYTVGRDTAGPLKLKVGTHEIVVRNRFLGEDTRTIDLAQGEPSTVTIDW